MVVEVTIVFTLVQFARAIHIQSHPYWFPTTARSPWRGKAERSVVAQMCRQGLYACAGRWQCTAGCGDSAVETAASVAVGQHVHCGDDKGSQCISMRGVDDVLCLSKE